MILLRRFVELFGRARPADMALLEQTRLRFMTNEMPLAIHSVEFDIAANMWTVKLILPTITDENVKQAVQALREPQYTFHAVPNTVRQSLADMIELLATQGVGHA